MERKYLKMDHPIPGRDSPMENIRYPRYLNEKEVADMTGFSLSTLRNNRFLSKGIPYIKVGKSVRYDLKEVVAFMERHRIQMEVFVE